jgi:hypothetical protein
MPVRTTRPRRNLGLAKHIAELYTHPSLRFLDGEHQPVADLVFGPVSIYLDEFFDESSQA